MGGDDMVWRYKPDHVRLSQQVGSTPPAQARTLFQRFEAAWLCIREHYPSRRRRGGRRSNLGGGVSVLAGAVIQPGSRIGANAVSIRRPAWITIV